MSENLSSAPAQLNASSAAFAMTGVLTVVSVAWLAAALWSTSNAYVDMFSTGALLSMALGCLLAAGTLVQICLLALKWPGEPEIAAWGGMFVGPLALAIWIAASVSGLPFDVRFAAGDADLERFATSVLDGSRTPKGTDAGRIGTYAIHSWYTSNGCVHLDTANLFLDRGGFAYCPGPEPLQYSSTRYEHISGPWYRWKWHF